MTIEPVLKVDGLNVWFNSGEAPAHVVRGVSFDVRAGEILAIVGESGCGKSVTAMTLLGLTRSRGARFSGAVQFGEHELLSLSEDGLRSVRGAGIAMVFQDPLTSLNPVMTVGAQIEEMLLLHRPISRSVARAQAVEMLKTVGIADADQRAGQYPHEFSGGMRQRAMIAMAMSCDPPVLIADEPTTALDVTIQAQILELITSLAHDNGSAVILITHDLGVVAETADMVAVMYAGEIVELASRDDLFSAPQHPYTWGLLASIPRVDQPRSDRLPSIEGQLPSPSSVITGCGFATDARLPSRHARSIPCSRNEPRLVTSIGVGCLSARGRSAVVLSTHEASASPLLEVVEVARHFTTRGGKPPVRAVDGVSLTVHPGETVGLIGESGSGKSTLARMMLRLEELNEGRVLFDGRDISHLQQREMRPLRKEMQMVFQDPFGSLNPRKRIGSILGDVFRVHRDIDNLERRVGELLDLVGLSPSFAERYPFDLSGGQRQRVGIARAVALRPRFVVADEPVSALDVSVQAQVLNLLTALQRDLGLTYVIVAHDLGVMRHVADRIAVMYLGKIVEIAGTDELLAGPRHPYTEALLSAVPVPDPTAGRRNRRIVLHGEVPSPTAPPSGCRFRTRCVHATDECAQVEPLLRPFGPGHFAACHHPVLESRPEEGR